ncbi:MAG: IclR family transcriptional regulator [Pseudomonadota bacterium]|nr:IclR family transcriptional regulator [Pseudomonadota bacterium]
MTQEDLGPKSSPLERYFTVLEAIAASPSGLTIRELELVLQLPKTTVNRLVQALTSSDLVQPSPRKGAFTLGPRLSRVLQADNEWLKKASYRILKALADETGETCFITRLSGTQIESVVMESPDAAVGLYVVPGHVMPPHATASGKVLTAFQSDEMRREILSPTLERITHRTIVDPAALEEEFQKIRTQGFATETGEHVQGLFTMACPIFPAPGRAPSIALGLTAPAERAAAQGIDRLLAMVQRSASEMEQLLSPLNPQAV